MPGERPTNLERILTLEVPISVRLGERGLRVSEVTAWSPGAIIELTKNADAELDLVVNNKVVGCGVAVKVGEKFGLRVTYIGDVKARAAAMAAAGGVVESEPEEDTTMDPAAALAEALLAGQMQDGV